MQLWQFRNKHTQERRGVQNEMCWVVFGVEACQEIPALKRKKETEYQNE